MFFTAVILGARDRAHVNSLDKLDGLVTIALADGTTPERARVVTVGLQKPFFPFQFSVNRPSNITDREIENAFPGRAPGRWIGPALLHGLIGAILAGFLIVVETCNLPCV